MAIPEKFDPSSQASPGCPSPPAKGDNDTPNGVGDCEGGRGDWGGSNGGGGVWATMPQECWVRVEADLMEGACDLLEEALMAVKAGKVEEGVVGADGDLVEEGLVVEAEAALKVERAMVVGSLVVEEGSVVVQVDWVEQGVVVAGVDLVVVVVEVELMEEAILSICTPSCQIASSTTRGHACMRSVALSLTICVSNICQGSLQWSTPCSSVDVHTLMLLTELPNQEQSPT